MILVHRLSAITKNSWRYTRNRLTHPGLTNAAYDICGIVYQSGSTNQDNISKALKMDKSSVAKVVNKCVIDGLIDRKVNPDNRREYILTLTEEGLTLVQELIELVEQWQNESLSELSDEERVQFMEMIQRVEKKSNSIIQV